MRVISKKQKRIIETNSSKAIVYASAAAGKTFTLTERVKFLLDKGVPTDKIVVITFTNAAAEEMKKRIGDPKGLFIGTVHSYSNYILLSSGILTDEYIQNEEFDQLFELVNENPECIQEIDYLIVDEAQDSTPEQLSFFKMIAPKNWMYFMDLRQSIYGFAGAEPENFIDILEDPYTEVFSLNENYRNGPTILNFAKKIINGTMMGDYSLYDDSICMREFTVDTCIEVDYSLEMISLILEKEEKDKYNKWFILTRNNEQIEVISSYLEKKGIPNDTFKRSQLSTSEFQEKMKENTVKVLTVHSAKGLEADNVIVVGVPKWNYNADERRVAYVAATRARNRLIWMKNAKKKKPRVEAWE